MPFLPEIATVLGILSTVIGCLSWWRAATRKAYAAEHDFQQLKANYAQLKEINESLLKALETIRKEQVERHVLLIGKLERIDWFLTVQCRINPDDSR